ncbi:MAG: response regulator transcription factor [Chloroflexi bacterium]|nr:response regulator transcription factor [Chloroflexota bacterium]
MDTSQTILVVDDESTIREVIRRYLERDGYTVVEAATGRTALEIASREKPDLIVLDLMLPGVDGLALTRQLRERGSQVPIVMLTAKGSTADRIHGLDTGADDYLAKPFSPQELMSRIRAVLRRAPPPSALPRQTLVLDDLQLDPGSRVVMVHGKEVALTAKEFDLLWLFARHPNQVFTRAQLLDQVWGYGYYGDPSTVTVTIRRLREKIERDPSQPLHLLTVWGVGYKFAVGGG